MKITGKLLNLLIVYSLTALTLNAETIQFGKRRNTKKENNINAAQIKDEEGEVASTTYSNLPKNEVINTFYADPLSDEFMGKGSSELDKERNRSTKDLLSEFEGQAKEINDNTEIPDEEDLVDQHSKEDRARIEARADELLKEAAIQESKNNTGEALLENSAEKISEKLSEKKEVKSIASYTELYTENASETSEITNISSSENGDIIENKDSEVAETSKDLPEEDPEFSNKPPQNDDVVIIEENLSGETIDIPDYEKMKGIVSSEEADDESSFGINKKKKEEESIKKKTKLTKKEKLLIKMSEPLEPVLLTEGKPKSDDDENEKVYTYSGLLIPEKQPLGRKKHMLRWVLKLDDGTRIPLKSNLKLLQEVKKDSILNDYVTISGKMRASAMEKELKYLVPDSIVNGLALKKSKDSVSKENKNLNTEEKSSDESNDINQSEVKSDSETKDDNSVEKEIKPSTEINAEKIITS